MCMPHPARSWSQGRNSLRNILRRLQAEKQLADWNRAREIRLSALRHRLLLYDGRCSVKTILEGLRDRFGWESAQKKSRRRPDHNKSLSNDQMIVWMLCSSDKVGNWSFSGIYGREWQDSILRQLRGFESMTWAIQADGFQNAELLDDCCLEQSDDAFGQSDAIAFRTLPADSRGRLRPAGG